jgi:hypothetical protein
MPRLKFRDLKERKNFTTDNFKVVTKSVGRGKKTKMRFAKTKAPSGVDAYRILGKA